MVGTDEVDHLKVKDLLSKVSGIPECDGELDVPKGNGPDAKYNLEDGGSTRAKAFSQDPHAVQGIGVKDIEAASSIH